MAYNSQFTGAQIDEAIGDVRGNKDAWSGKQDVLLPSGAKVGDLIKVKAVDASGKPTAWAVAKAGTDYLKTAPVTSVNGKTGAVALAKGDIGLSQVDNVRQYSAQNPPPYPVTSVNGKTGAVTVREVPPVTASDNGKSAAVVNGAWAAVDKTPFYVNCTISGYGVYDNEAMHDKTLEEIVAAYQAGRLCYAAVKLSSWGDTAGRFILPLVEINTSPDFDTGFAIFGFSSIDSADTPDIIDVQFIRIDYSASAEGIVTDRYLPENTQVLPEVSTSDNGKFLRVVNGAWAAAAIDNANGGSF